uniref:RING finger protein 37 n=1 Tax=Geotrypetes seraphini TaxID=260995 RepID=A0A6P8RVR2_GEOSA|nr:RING finger protein 37 [Geotrypetes seraphini]XP_033808856.1 RING finger protein 37 [Geotrypetes seraphini]XP_033808866.1 RING finger protein 37 [Geotrypetes seraphini]XP_033808874.1 RING finger protein 37 [Geotrypetes seraphini]XP_033808883.1 RING finger protein 37 [Geotrypetes seraphini]
MVVNFCLPQFKPRIHCNKISGDGYEVENLISEDLTRRNRGFRSEYFIKPPVHITLTFPFNIDICRINIDTSVGGPQHSTGLEIYTSTSLNRASWNSIESPVAPVACQNFSDKDIFTLVGKVLLKSQSRVTFNHRGFKPRPPFHQTDSFLLYPDSITQDLWVKGPSSLSNVTHLKLVIFHVTGGAFPCIKKLEVWGQPAKSCSQEVIDSLLQVICKSKSPSSGLQNPVLPTDAYMANSSADNRQQNLQEQMDIVLEVPEEFLDPITLEIMTFPMLLPSGKVIDQSTLEKCNQSEAAWGRMPSDPFTGVTYSQHSHPLPHPPLKARIDSFLLQHTIPGTNILGRAQAGPVRTSTIAVSSLKRKIDYIEPTSNDKNVEPFCFSARNCVVTSAAEACAKRMKFIAEVDFAQMDCSAGPVSHEQRLSESLDIALNSALGCRPSFTTKLVKGEQQLRKGCDSNSSWSSSTVFEQSRSTTAQRCVSCSRTFSLYFKTEPIYQLPCGHIMCRPCIAEKQKFSSILCGDCEKSVPTHDVVRVHL